MIINLGVVNLPYSGDQSITTVDVATILEGKYHVIGTYAELHLDDIAGMMESSVANALESVMAGAPATLDPFADAEAEIEESFKFVYLERGEIEGLVPGTPTQASLDRRSGRFKSGKATSPRPSFIDTGLYSSAFKVWVEE